MLDKKHTISILTILWKESFGPGNLTTSGRGIGKTPPIALSEDQVSCQQMGAKDRTW